MPVQLQDAAKIIAAVSASLLLASCLSFNDAVDAPAIGERYDSDAAKQRLIAIAERNGLDPDRYFNAPQSADFDELSSAIKLLANDLRYGEAPASSRKNWHVEDDEYSEVGDDLFRAAADNLAIQIEAMAPNHTQYNSLKSRLETLHGTDSPEHRLLRLNMDRWRWMRNNLGADYILVNAPSFEAIIVRNGEEISRHRAIIGSRSTPTPQFSTEATGIRVRPTWFVPQSIVRESVGSLIKNDPTRAAQLGYVESGDGSVRQLPGPANALGEMILVMPNRFSVFLHDTPAKALFEKESRALSHGCVRIDNAREFAKSLLAEPDKIKEYDAALAQKKTKTIRFEQPIPVYIGYFTAFADGAGEITYYQDIYGLDQEIVAAISSKEYAALDRTLPEGCPSRSATPN